MQQKIHWKIQLNTARDSDFHCAISYFNKQHYLFILLGPMEKHDGNNWKIEKECSVFYPKLQSTNKPVQQPKKCAVYQPYQYNFIFKKSLALMVLWRTLYFGDLDCTKSSPWILKVYLSLGRE